MTMLGIGTVTVDAPRSELDPYGPERDAWAVLAAVCAIFKVTRIDPAVVFSR